MREVKLEYYVLNHNFNKNKIEYFNIFDNISVYECAVREAKKYLRSPSKYTYKSFSGEVITGYEAFVKELDNIVKWQEWARCEYEIAVGDLFIKDINKLEKWDCYQQFHPNRYIVADYVLKQVRQFLKESKNNLKQQIPNLAVLQY